MRGRVQQFPPSRRGFIFITSFSFQLYPPHVGQHRQPRHNRGSRPPGGGMQLYGILGESTTVVRVRVREPGVEMS
jgi:hypothetical protein